ncbi:MAG TPA: TonB-dependent receptor [Bryobacteraceae bacterium]|nr:TonB-dependent receptor [Bryobacteraceae bacterium]
MSRMSRWVSLGLLCSLISAPTAFAQSTFGSITGTVTDPDAALIPGADVDVTNEGTGATRRTTTSTSGVFNVPTLDLGRYKVRVSRTGFSTYERTGLVLTANQIINLEINLAVGATTTLVEVQGTSPVIATESHDLSGTVSHEALTTLPLVGRQRGDGGIYSFATLSTGVAAVPSSSTPIIGGSRSSVGILPQMDGIAVMAYPQGASPVQPSLESVQELKIETSSAPAEFTAAGNVQVITRSGTNEYHGSAYWMYNGHSLNARNFFAAVRPFRVYNNIATSLGGPIKRNKLFFFGTYEASRESVTTTLLQSNPLPAWKQGNFAGQRTINDPTTGSPFPGNQIPANRISPVSQRIQQYAYPDPNLGAPGALTSNWTAQYPGKSGFTHFDHFDVRGDYNVTSSDQVFVRVSWRRMPLRVPGIYPLYREQLRRGQSTVLAWNHTISPSAVNEFRFGTTYHRNFYEADVVGSDLIRQFGIIGVPTTGVKTGPNFAINGVQAWNPDTNSNNYQDNPQTTLQWIDNVSWTRGRHFLKFGADIVRDRFNGNNIASNVYGTYNFNGNYTGIGYADFLLGIPQTTSLALPNPNRHLRGTTWGVYAQDQFKVSSRLTVNYGVRMQVQHPYTDTLGALYSWDPKTNALVVMDEGLKIVNNLFPKDIPVVTASQAGYPSTLVRFNKFNAQPRVGFAYKPFGEKTVLRGGYGIYTNLIYATLARSHLSGGPFAGSVSYNNQIVNGQPLFSFPSPFLTTGTASVQNVNGVNPDLKTPYTQQWNLTVERQVGSVGLRTSYAGSRSVNLVYRKNLNLPLPSTTPFTTARRPNQRFNQTIWADNGGTDAYHALEIAAQKKQGRNLTFSTGYTWAKDLTDTQDSGGGGTTFAGQVIQNPNNRAIEKANNGLVVAQRWFAYALYTLPFGKGERFLANAPAAVQHILGGWQTTWTAVAQKGQYFTPSFTGYDPSGTGTIGGVPDRVANGNLGSGRSVQRFFDTAAFVVPGCPATAPLCTQTTPIGRFGNSGFNILEGPPIRNLDVGIQKVFKLTERVNLQFSSIFVNIFNHPNFSVPPSNISAPAQVGIISGQTRPLLGEPGPREIDFTLRLSF